MHIKIKKGLNIPIKGKPTGSIKELNPSGEGNPKGKPQEFSLNLWEFEDIRLKLLKKVGENVKIGEPICEDKGCAGRMFVSPASGVIKDVRRGLKRRIMDVIIKPDGNEEYLMHEKLHLDTISRSELVAHLMKGGMFAKIRQRPFNMLANPNQKPRSIFVKAIDSAPFAPPPEVQIQGHEQAFQVGLNALKKMTDGAVHLVYPAGSTCQDFTHAEHVERHTAEGPHPIGTHSLHIQHIDPIKSAEDVVWTLNLDDVISIGTLIRDGKYKIDRVISIAGPGVIEGQSGFFKVREGHPVAAIVAGRIPKSPTRLISGDPLMGNKVTMEDFLGFSHHTFCVIPENTQREFLHFFRLGISKYSFSRAYASGHFDNSKHEYDFTTNQHGEHRAFIDPTLYDEIMALKVPTMQLVKAVMSEDYELAEELGLLEVAPEDFALPTFVCPSKMEMTEIVKQGLRAHAAEMLE